MRLTSLGWSVVAGGVLLTSIGVGLGLVACTAIGVLCLALVGIGMCLVAEAPRLDVARLATPPEVQRNSPAGVRLGLTAAGRRRRPVTIVEQVGGRPRVARIGELGPNERVVEYDVDTSRRGVIVAGPLIAQRDDPFGLVRAERRYGGSCSVRVRPRVLPLRMLPSGRQRDLEGPTRERSEGTASFHQIRPYQMGDDLRRVHWRTTARVGDLMVKQLFDTTRPELVVVLDNRAVAIGEQDFEEAVDIAATVLRAAETDDFPTTLLFAEWRWDHAGHSPWDARAAVPHLDRLTDVQRSTEESLLAIGKDVAARGRSLVFISGELPGPDLVAVGQLAKGFHPALLVSVANDRTMPLVPPPGVRALACATATQFVAEWGAVW